MNEPDISQAEVFAFLEKPSTHGTDSVERVDTHAACVFLAGNRALKVKRAVRFPFLDYSTLQKRKSACEEEIRINQPFAAAIYRGVIPITRNENGTLAIGGSGVPVEWAVDMLRFDETGTLDRLARAGAISANLGEKVATLILSSHAAAQRTAGGPWIDSIPQIIERNTAAFRASPLLATDTIDNIDAMSRAAFAKLKSLLASRGQDGFVRRCHGDLHLANIAMIDGEPVLFDAIEFDAGIASVDILYDLAFVLMDLERFGCHEAANAVFNTYLGQSWASNSHASCLLPLFMSMRAAIRANVLLARLAQTADQDKTLQDNALAYFDLAHRLINPAPPRLVAVGGLSGTGKSSLARQLACFILPSPGAVILRSDVIRKRLFGVAETERLPDDAYRPEHSKAVYDEVATNTANILGQGLSVIVDAVFSREDERLAIADIARARQTNFSGIFLTADLETRLARIQGRVKDASDATLSVAKAQEHYDVGTIGWSVVDASGTPEQTLLLARQTLTGM